MARVASLGNPKRSKERLARPSRMRGGLVLIYRLNLRHSSQYRRSHYMALQDEPIKQQEWHALKAEDVLRNLAVQSKGLTTEEAQGRLEQYGPNQLQEAPRPTFLHMLWEQLNNFVVILLIVAS